MVRPEVGIDQESGQAGFFGRGLKGRKRHIKVCHPGIAHEGLGAGQREAAALAEGEQRVGADTRAWAIFINGQGAKFPALGQGRQIVLLLRVAAPLGDGMGRQRMVVEDRGNRRTGPRKGLDHLDMIDKAGPDTAGCHRDQQPEEVVAGQLVDDPLRKDPAAIQVQRHRIQMAPGKCLGVPADLLLRLGQFKIHDATPFGSGAAPAVGARSAREITRRWI